MFWRVNLRRLLAREWGYSHSLIFVLLKSCQLPFAVVPRAKHTENCRALGHFASLSCAIGHCEGCSASPNPCPSENSRIATPGPASMSASTRYCTIHPVCSSGPSIVWRARSSGVGDMSESCSRNCPLTVRELGPKPPNVRQTGSRYSERLLGLNWFALFRIGGQIPLITQRSLVQIQPPQPI